jgi:hypothetical protein
MFSLSRSPIHRIAELRRSTFPAAFAPASKNHACSLPVPDHEFGGVQRWGRASHSNLSFNLGVEIRLLVGGECSS